jgi:hypothetical protein
MDALFAKLRLKPTHRAAVLDAPDFLRGAVAKLSGVATSLDGKRDFVLVFATKLAAVKKQAHGWKRALDDGGILWVGYPKGKALGTDLNRDVLRVELEALGLEAVANVAVDDTWSALRFKKVD